MIFEFLARRFAATVLLALSVCGNSFAQAPEVLRIATDEWCPYMCVDNGKVSGGYLADVVEQAMQLRGYKVEFVVLLTPTKAELKAAMVQGSFVSPPDSDFRISDALGYSRQCFYTLSDSHWTFSGVESLDSVTIGISDDFSFGIPELDQHIEKNRRNHHRIDIAHGEHASMINLNKLLGMRFQVLAEDEAVMAMQVDKLQVKDKVRQAGCAGKPVPIYIGFFADNAQSDEYLKALNLGMKQLADSGRLAALKQQYKVSDLSASR